MRRKRGTSRTRQWHEWSLDICSEIRHIANMVEIRHEPVRDIERGSGNPDQPWPEPNARPRQAVTILQKGSLIWLEARELRLLEGKPQGGIANRAADKY
jgi:hypothetical protein